MLEFVILCYYITPKRKIKCRNLTFIYDFMILINRKPLRRLNGRCDLTFNHIAYERLVFHRICTFHQNIIFLVHTETGKQKDCVRDPASGTVFPLKKDHFYFIPNETPAEYLFTDDITFMTFHFNLELYPGMDLYHGLHGIRSGHDPELTARIWDIFGEEDEFRSVVRFKAAIMDFCQAHWPSVRRNELGPYSPLFLKIRERCSAQLTVTELAEEEGITQEAFSRRIRRALGTTPKKLIQSELLRRITALLADPDITISDIAGMLRFSSVFYLSRFFRDQTGMSPTAYRERCTRQNGSISRQ